MGRFRKNEIIALLDQRPEHNLGESTSQDLALGEIIDGDVLERLKSLRLGYGSSQGEPELRAHIAANLGVSPDEVIVTVGGSSALFATTFVLCKPGDEAVVTSPNFPPTIEVIRAVGAELRPVRLEFDNGYRVAREAFAEALSADTKLVSFATPQNPSGVAFSRQDCEAVLALMGEICPDAYLVIDETYRESVYGEAEVPPSLANLSPRVITIASMSKCHGAPGLRIGWMSCREPALAEQLVLAKLNTVITCSVVDECLALEVLRRADTVLGERRHLLGEAIVKVEHWVERHSHLIEWVRPDGGALCCVRLRPERFDAAGVETFHRELGRNSVLVAQGSWFGEEARIFRLGFGYPPPGKLQGALDAVGRALDAASG
jgi:aspartate/methionine/tyrosine aminotransferase